jgi:hypothetical protein
VGTRFSPLNWSAAERAAITGYDTQPEPIGRMTKTQINRTIYAERDHLKNCITCIVFVNEGQTSVKSNNV